MAADIYGLWRLIPFQGAGRSEACPLAREVRGDCADHPWFGMHLRRACPARGGTGGRRTHREFFVAAWCLHPRFILEEKVIFVPEPGVHAYERSFYRRADELPGLRYLMRLRIVEYQDWNTPSASSDDGDHVGGAAADDDSGDSNYNRYHPGLDDGRSRRDPRTVRFAGAGDDAPYLGRGGGPHSSHVGDRLRGAWCRGGARAASRGIESAPQG